MAERRDVSDLLLEQFILGELPSALAARVASELERDPELRARRDAIVASDKEILDRHPPRETAEAIRRRLLRVEESRQSRRRSFPLVIGIPAAAALLVFLSLFVVRERLVVNETRLKGLSTHLAVFRKTTQGAEELKPGTVAGRGEILQLSYTAGDARYGVIFSVDGRGAVTWHLPTSYAGGPRSAPSLDRQGQVILPSAYELDDAPGFERFFFVYSSASFDTAAVAQAARALPAGAAATGVLPLPAGLQQFSLLLKKRGSAP